MAIREEEGTSGPGTTARQTTSSGNWSMHDGGLFGAPIPKGMGSEYYNKVKDGLIELYKQANHEVEIGVLDLSRAVEPSLDFSCILVTTRLRDQPTLGVAVHVLLLSETGEEIPPYIETVFDKQIYVYRVPSDAINEILVKKAQAAVSASYKNTPVLFVDGCVITKRFKPDDKQAMQRLALNAAMAGVTELNTRRQDFQDLNLAKLARGDQTMVEVTFHRQQLEDAAKNVYRSDVLISLSNRKGGENQRDRQLNSGDRNAVFSQLSAYVDTLWWPMSQQSGGFGNVFQPQQTAQTQKYVARCVITDISAQYSQTPGAVLLALSTATAMRNPEVWMQAFRPLSTAKNTVDISDIGALNIEGNLPVPTANGLVPDPSGYGKPIDTKEDGFKSEQLGMLIHALFHKELMICMDVPEYGPQTQYLSLFTAAAQGVQGALVRIVESANVLTNGSFGKHFGKASQLFATGSERIHAGYWTDNNGNQRDLRDFDHIAVANLVGVRNPQMLRDWSDTFLRTEFPEIQRLEARRKMLTQLTGDTAVFTGYYRRLTLHRDFLEALDRGIQEQNLRINIRTPMSGADFYNQRGVASYAAGALLGYGNSYMQAGGYAASPGAPSNFQQYRF